MQHLDPQHKSHLSELLGKSAPFPVIEAADGVKVEADHVYVIPPAVSLTLIEGRLSLAPRKMDGKAPHSVDAFFHSLAMDNGNQSIGVILSGVGTDGTRGLAEVKSAGGIIFA